MDVLNVKKLAIKYKLKNWLRHNFFIYNHQKLLLNLTFVLIFAIYLTIRGSTFPLMIDNDFFYILFVTEPDSDKTLYNIGISIIAAYIFYIFQVFIPEKSKCSKHIKALSMHLEYEIFLMEQLIKSYQVFITKDEKRNEYLLINKEFVYVSNRGEKPVYELLFTETITNVAKPLEDVIDSSFFNELDVSFQELVINALTEIESVTKTYLHYLRQSHYAKGEVVYWLPKTEKLVLNENEYKDMQIRIENLLGYSRILQKICRYKFNIDEDILPYAGKSSAQELFDLL